MKSMSLETHRSRKDNAQRWLWGVAAAFMVVMILMALFWSRTKRGVSANHGLSTANGRLGGGSGAFAARSKMAQGIPIAAPRGSAKAAEEIVADKVRQFGQKRRVVAERIAKRRKEDLPPEIDAFFKAIDKGDWKEISSRWKELATHTHQYDYSKDDRQDLEPYWQSVLDAYGVAEQAHEWPAQRLLDYGNAIMDSLRPGMVYVGGTDNGRWVPEMMNETSGGDPHIMITQNALADSSYLDYVSELYGGQINTLSQEDSQRAFAEYTADAQKRYQHDLDFPNEPKQLMPGENVTMVDGKVQVTGQVAVMAINERLLQMLMAQNPDLSYALQESFPLRGTYANAVPLGPLMELNAPSGQGAFTSVSAEQSVDYWRSATQGLMANPGEDNAHNAQMAYSKDINATANLLAAHSFTAQAEEAYLLASQVQPDNPEAVSGLAQLWAKTGRADQAQALLDQFASKYPSQSKAIDQARATIVWSGQTIK